jgi:GT2 family glycosyltransferase
MDPKIIERLGLVIATVGRREIVEATLRSLAGRASLPSIVIVVGAAPADLPELKKAFPFVLQVIQAPKKGLCLQRNIGVKAMPAGIEFVSFLDDDMEVHDIYFAEVENVFASSPGLAGFSGCIMANGNIERQDGRELLDEYEIGDNMPLFGAYPKSWPALYGCAMNIRRTWLKIEKFDERLPLYALGEDCEMGFRLARHGEVGGSGRCPVVHLAARSGRISEYGYGYAQVINYLYFSRKGIGLPALATYANKLIRTPLTNLIFAVAPRLDRKKGIDRRGRFLGNLRALADVLRGRIDPQNLLAL